MGDCAFELHYTMPGEVQFAGRFRQKVFVEMSLKREIFAMWMMMQDKVTGVQTERREGEAWAWEWVTRGAGWWLLAAWSQSVVVVEVEVTKWVGWGDESVG